MTAEGVIGLPDAQETAIGSGRPRQLIGHSVADRVSEQRRRRVPIVSLDPSGLVMLVIEEAGSDLAVELSDGCDAAMASRVPYSNVRSALASASRHCELEGCQRAAGRLGPERSSPQ